MKKFFAMPVLLSLAFGVGTVYGAVIGSGVAWGMMDCPSPELKGLGQE